jgi:hypothetical protein
MHAHCTLQQSSPAQPRPVVHVPSPLHHCSTHTLSPLIPGLSLHVALRVLSRSTPLASSSRPPLALLHCGRSCVHPSLTSFSSAARPAPASFPFLSHHHTAPRLGRACPNFSLRPLSPTPTDAAIARPIHPRALATWPLG